VEHRATQQALVAVLLGFMALGTGARPLHRAVVLVLAAQALAFTVVVLLGRGQAVLAGLGFLQGLQVRPCLYLVWVDCFAQRGRVEHLLLHPVAAALVMSTAAFLLAVVAAQAMAGVAVGSVVVRPTAALVVSAVSLSSGLPHKEQT
jgi:hypothetical protein